jgi:serine/threonine-protein kinase
MLAKDKVLKGRYRIIDQLGQDETGAVYEAYDSVRKTHVAIKEIFIDSEKVPAINKRELLKRAFAERAKTLAEVKHESLPQVRGYFSEFDRQYLVMELIDGKSAGELLAKNNGALPFSEIAVWTDQLLDVIDYLHTHSTPIIHGDVKPQNVKLTSRGRIKLLGFDITESPDAKVSTIVTNPNSFDAGLPYLPLEQLLQTADLMSEEDKKNHRAKLDKVLKQPIDARSDIYALGATLYHLLTAQAPVNAFERTLETWTEKPDPLSFPHQINPSISLEVSDVLMKALEIEPENRFVSAIEMRGAMQTAIEQAKQRETEEAQNQEKAAVRESLLAEEKRLEQERRLVEQERLKLEAEQKQQKELIERQLKTAEAERLKAEQRAAEAEKRLLEEEARKTADNKAAVSVKAETNNAAAVAPPVDVFSNISDKRNSNAADEDSKSLFAEPMSDKKTSWLMPVIVVMFLLVGGAGAGIWMLQSSNKVEANQTVPTRADSLSAEQPTPAPTVADIPQATIEKTSTTNTAPVSTPAGIEKTVSQPAIKNNPVPPRIAQTEKPAAPKPAANRKKAVTVDDIISGN